MKNNMKKTLPIFSVLLVLFSAGCEVNNHEKYSEIPQVNFKEKNRFNLDLMLSEILKTRILNIASQRADVSDIVSRYFHSGMSKNEIINLVSNKFEILENTDSKLLIHYLKGEGYLGNRRDLYISLFFNENGQLIKNVSYLDKINNL